MAVEVVASPPFGGKGRFARGEVARREAAGELGLVVLDWSLLFRALFPGEQSSLRDESVSDTGAPRMAGALFDLAVGMIAARELSGYVVVQSPRRAVEIAERLNAPIIEVDADPGDVASRAERHMQVIRRTVTRAAAGALRTQCRRQAVTYYREQDRLVGRARVARPSGRGYRVDPQPKRAFDRAAFERGLTPRGREALAALKAAGNEQPSPADIMSWILRDRQ